MEPFIFGLLGLALGIFLLLYVIFRRSFIRAVMEISLAVLLAIIFKKIGIADELAFFALGLTIAMAFFIRKI